MSPGTSTSTVSIEEEVLASHGLNIHTRMVLRLTDEVNSGRVCEDVSQRSSQESASAEHRDTKCHLSRGPRQLLAESASFSP